MTKRRMSKASKRRLTLLGPLSIFFIIYFSFSLIYNTYTLYHLKSEKKKLENNYAGLQKEAEDLKINIEKLNDPDYLANYARENYLYSKDGEYILKIDEIKKTNDNIDDINVKLKKQYLIYLLSFIMIIIFVYIISKGKKRKK